MAVRPPPSAYAAAIGTTFAFGLSFVATKFALRGFPPMSIAMVRFTVAGVVLWALWRARRRRERLTRADLLRLAALGFVSLTLYFALEINGIARTSASEAAIIIATIPIFVGVLAVVVLREQTDGRRWLGIALSFVGVVALVMLGGEETGGTLLGNVLVLGAAMAAAVYNLMARRLMVSRSALYVTAYQHLFGAVFTAPLALAELLSEGPPRPSPSSLAGLSYLIVGCSVVAYLLLNYAFRFLEASRVAVFINLTPVVAVVAAFVLLGERLTEGQATAAVAVVVGVWVANTGGRASRVPVSG